MSSVSINKLQLKPEQYPQGFEQQLQQNLDFFLDGVGVSASAKVPFDTIFVREGEVEHDFFVNTTEIGLYLNILVEVHKAGDANALVRIQETLKVLVAAPTWKGLFYWPYDIVEEKLLPQEEGIIPAVDNANLAFALAGVSGAYLDSDEPQEIDVVNKVELLLNRQLAGWQSLYDEEKGLLRAGWSGKDNAPLDYYVDRKANESRLAPLWAHLITQGNPVPQSAFSKMELYTQAYQVEGKSYSPMLTWDGAYFQGMLPAIWLNEKALIPDYSMIEDMTVLQHRHAKEHKISMVSSAATTSDSYAAFGVPSLSEAKVRFDIAIAGGDTGTPHAMALSYMVEAQLALQGLHRIKQQHPQIETPFGWLDAVDTEGNVSSKIISLDQGMFVCAFIAKEINQHVERYLNHKGYSEAVAKMYQSFVPNNTTDGSI